jgi:eukaryotic-like serine/threonine-protein kinase
LDNSSFLEVRVSETNQRIGDYEILAPIGAGGMGRVFKVRNVISNREEAMKVLLPDFASQPELAARFLAEIRTLATLEHPNITQLRTAFDYQGHFVMVMEYVEGATLETLASGGRIPLEQMLDYASQTLAGLSYAHGHGVTHRDIKPANIMITTHGVAKLMDFGIAKSTEDVQLTRPGTTMGSVYYMSPEQVQGGPIDARSDIYSFGVTLYEMFTGRKPFVSESSYTVLNAQINENPVPLIEVNPDLPVELNDIVLKAMAKDPAARFQNADAMRNALRGLRGAQAAAVPVSTPVAAASATAAAGAVPSATAAVSAVPDLASSASAVNEAPKFTPVPQVAPVAQKSKSNRGLWIVLGAVAAVLAIVAVATLVPRFYPMFAKHSSASSTTAAQSDAASTPAAPASSQPADTTSAASQPAAALVASAPTTIANQAASVPANSNPPAKTARQPYVPQSANASPAALTNAPVVPAGPDPAQIREVKDKLMNLSARADGVRSGVQALRSQQQAQGLDLRTDIVASLSRMNNDLAEAQQSLNERDLNGANEYIDRADREVAKLEAFLGH